MATYAPINPVPTSWTTAPAASELVIWQCRSGTVLLTTGGAMADASALVLNPGEAIPISANIAVSYRAVSAGAHISRNAA